MENNFSRKNVYLDYAATTPIRPEVLEAMMSTLRDKFGSASSLHSLGIEAKKALERARAEIAESIGAQPDEVIFTSGGTEADNLAIQGIGFANLEKGNHIITSAIEHVAILNTCRFMEKMGFKVTYIPIDRYGRVDPDEVKKRITSRTILISIMHANNEIGTIQLIQEISTIAREKEILFHTDAIQTLGKIPFDVTTLKVDALSLSGHKIYGPKGVGVLYIRKDVKIRPLLWGGGHERGIRSGTENVAGIVGMAHAIKRTKDEMPIEMKRQAELRDRLINGIFEKIEGASLNGHPVQRLPGHVHFSFSGLDAHNLVMALDAKGIGVSMGSACSSLHSYPSHVLKEIGLSEELALGSIRITTGLYTTPDDIEYVLNTLPSAVEECRKSGIDREKLDEALMEKITALQEEKGGCESIKKIAWSYIFRKASSKIFKKRK